MSLKMKLVSMISAFVLVIGMLLIGVFAVERVQVDMGGSITFNADDVYARVTGSVTKAQVEPEVLDVTYSAYETIGNPTAWESLDLEFDSYATPIVISITVENLSTERSLTVNLTDALTSSVPNLGKELKRDNGTYTSGTNIPLDPKDNGTSTTTFTITLSVNDKNQSLTNAQFDYDLNLFDENYKFPEVYDYFTFSDNGDETVTLTGFNAGLADGKTDIVIPATVSRNADGQWMDGDDYTVVGLKDVEFDTTHYSPQGGVFTFNGAVTSVVLPETFKRIGDYEFYYCSNLTSITLPEGLTSIGDYAFYGCSNLQPSITDDNGVKYLGSEQNPYLVLWDGTDITSSSYIVNENCKFIHSSAFRDCSGLTSITLPKGLASIGVSAFYGCYNLQPSITDDNGAKYLGSEQNPYLVLWDGTDITSSSYTVNPDCRIICYDAFENCVNLTRIDLPEGLTSIGYMAFYGCSGLTSITLPEGLISIGRSVFENCVNLTRIDLPDSLTSIGYMAFRDCNSLTSITLPSSRISIKSGLFEGCTSLTSITLPSSLTSIGSYAFDGCYALAEIYNYSSLNLTIESGTNWAVANYVKVVYNLSDGEEKPATRIQTIDNVQYYVYEDDFIALIPTSRDISSVNLDSQTTEINLGAFDDCSNLQPSITDDNGVKYLGNEQNPYLVLWDGTDITSSSYTVNPDCRIICYDAFEDCSSLTSITLLDGLTSIGRSAFSSCSSLTSITLPDSLTSIGSYAFSWCSGLKSITLPSSLTSIGGSAFFVCDITEVIIDSEYVYDKATSNTACGGVLSYATTVKVLTSLDDGTNSYITTNFTKGPTEVIGDKNYTVYSK